MSGTTSHEPEPLREKPPERGEEGYNRLVEDLRLAAAAVAGPATRP